MRKTIFFKTFSGYLAIALGLSVLVLFFSYREIKKSYINTFTSELADVCKLVNPQAELFIKSNDLAGLDKFVKKLEVQTHKRITIIDLEGNVLADSENDPKAMNNHKTRPEVQQVLGGQTGKSLRYSFTIKENMLYVAMPIINNGKIAGILRSSMFLKDINILLNNIMLHVIGVTGLILLVSIFIAVLFSRNMSVPIARLIEASKKIASGDFHAAVTLKNNDELKDLANNFNRMAERISFLFNALSNQKEELSTVINAITEGLFVVDSNDKIKISNRSLKKIAQNNDADNKYYWEVLRMQGFKDLIKKAKEEKVVCVSEIEIYENIYACSVVPLAGGNENVIVLHDITQAKNLEKKKKEFVANVSHELRTPLTAIKGFAETLENETTPEGRRYVEIIKKNSERLIKIVEDLLTLSQIEKIGFQLEISKVNLKELIESAVKIFETKAKEKNIAIKSEIQGKLEPINADSFRLEQMLVNLIDNALKYTDKGEINVSVKQDAKQVVLAVSDTGIGIPKEHLSNIFERFYVIDKSRSRKLGGTGLGLSIVKHIVLMHGGSINAESDSAKGSKFTVTIPT